MAGHKDKCATERDVTVGSMQCEVSGSQSMRRSGQKPVRVVKPSSDQMSKQPVLSSRDVSLGKRSAFDQKRLFDNSDQQRLQLSQDKETMRIDKSHHG